MNSDTAGRVARRATTSRTFHALARTGFAVNGLLHILIGVIALSVALGSGGGDADQGGALRALSDTPFGVALLWIVVIGLAALGLWLVLDAVLTFTPRNRDSWKDAGVTGAKGLVYLALAVTAIGFLTGSGSDSGTTTTDFTADLLAHPGGVILVVLLGLVVIGIGGYFIVKGATKRFERDIAQPGGTIGRATRTLGTIGYVAKGVVLIVVGILFVVAAFATDPDKATGLDGALKALADLPFGVVILIVVALGLVAYGVYCFARARFARL